MKIGEQSYRKFLQKGILAHSKSTNQLDCHCVQNVPIYSSLPSRSFSDQCCSYARGRFALYCLASNHMLSSLSASYSGSHTDVKSSEKCVPPLSAKLETETDAALKGIIGTGLGKYTVSDFFRYSVQLRHSLR